MDLQNNNKTNNTVLHKTKSFIWTKKAKSIEKYSTCASRFRCKWAKFIFGYMTYCVPCTTFSRLSRNNCQRFSYLTIFIFQSQNKPTCIRFRKTFNEITFSGNPLVIIDIITRTVENRSSLDIIVENHFLMIVCLSCSKTAQDDWKIEGFNQSQTPKI